MWITNWKQRRKKGSLGRSAVIHDDDCFHCRKGGELLLCDTCPRVFHLSCVGLRVVPAGNFDFYSHLESNFLA